MKLLKECPNSLLTGRLRKDFIFVLQLVQTGLLLGIFLRLTHQVSEEYSTTSKLGFVVINGTQFYNPQHIRICQGEFACLAAELKRWVTSFNFWLIPITLLAAVRVIHLTIGNYENDRLIALNRMLTLERIITDANTSPNRINIATV